MRYLVRLANSKGFTPNDVKTLQADIRKVLGSVDKIGNLRISTPAIEFDLFAEEAELEHVKNDLETRVSRLLTLRSLEPRASTKEENQVLREGIDLFNQERFWEAHEVLEEIWHPAGGTDRDLIQGLILTAAALVHLQKNENSVCISMLSRAREKLGDANDFKALDIAALRASITQILESRTPIVFRIGWIESVLTRPDEFCDNGDD